MRTALLLPLVTVFCNAAGPSGNLLLADYFEREVASIEKKQQAVPANSAQWETMRAEGKLALAEMLGLSPLPPRTPLNVTKTSETAGDGFVVENLHFQARPGLYVTANLYRPAQVSGKLPAILYVCGHSNMRAKDGASLGNKAGYAHHGAWFARNGYICLAIDTVQLGEIRGEHHGTYSRGRWWWISRGYTPAGLEAWSGIRALDYLETRPDVDATRFGVTGRSGGGAYSWWIAALDDRIKVVAPTAGITTLRNHIVDGTVAGHCDCMFTVNYRRWDYDRVAALVAPRPLLISNTDKDNIFPLDGVMAVHDSVRRVYRALGVDAKLGLQIAEGPHHDTQSLNVGAFAWFERFLKGADPMALLDEAAAKRIDPEKLRVFGELPKDEINTKADETFVAAAISKVPADAAEWTKQCDEWMRGLRETVFAGWPAEPEPMAVAAQPVRTSDGIAIREWNFTAQSPWRLKLWVVSDAGIAPSEITEVSLDVLDAESWRTFDSVLKGETPDALKTLRGTKNARAFVCPRGVGPTEWTGAQKELTQNLRRFYLLGQTLESMQVWDIRRAIAAIRETEFSKASLQVSGQGNMGVNALYAALFEAGIARATLVNPPSTHTKGPVFPGVMRVLDIPQAVALATSRMKVVLRTVGEDDWAFARTVAQKLAPANALELSR